jgi:hypothetical protein
VGGGVAWAIVPAQEMGSPSGSEAVAESVTVEASYAWTPGVEGSTSEGLAEMAETTGGRLGGVGVGVGRGGGVRAEIGGGEGDGAGPPR